MVRAPAVDPTDPVSGPCIADCRYSPEHQPTRRFVPSPRRVGRNPLAFPRRGSCSAHPPDLAQQRARGQLDADIGHMCAGRESVIEAGKFFWVSLSRRGSTEAVRKARRSPTWSHLVRNLMLCICAQHFHRPRAFSRLVNLLRESSGWGRGQEPLEIARTAQYPLRRTNSRASSCAARLDREHAARCARGAGRADVRAAQRLTETSDNMRR